MGNVRRYVGCCCAVASGDYRAPERVSDLSPILGINPGISLCICGGDFVSVGCANFLPEFLVITIVDRLFYEAERLGFLECCESRAAGYSRPCCEVDLRNRYASVFFVKID